MVLSNLQKWLYLILIVNFCNNLIESAPPLGSLLPRIQSLFYDLTPSGNGYYLRLSPISSQREEMVEFKNPDTPEAELSVMGTIMTTFLPDGYKIVTVYVADGNGYRAKYKFERLPPEQRPQFLSPTTLKIAAG